MEKMKSYDYLITLGCSWTEGIGDEQNNQGWAGRLAQHLSNINPSIELINLGGGAGPYKFDLGDSNWLQWLNFNRLDHEKLKGKSVLVIWGLTAFSRLVKSNNRQEFITWYSPDLGEDFLDQYYWDDVNQFQQTSLIFAWQSLCKLKNYDHYLFVSFDDIDRIDGTYEFHHSGTFYSLIDRTKILSETSTMEWLKGKDVIHSHENYEVRSKLKKLSQIRNFFKIDSKNHPNFAPDGHPNARGYELWASYLYNRLNLIYPHCGESTEK